MLKYSRTSWRRRQSSERPGPAQAWWSCGGHDGGSAGRQSAGAPGPASRHLGRAAERSQASVSPSEKWGRSEPLSHRVPQSPTEVGALPHALHVPSASAQLRSEPFPLGSSLLSPGQSGDRAAPTHWPRWSPGASEGRCLSDSPRAGLGAIPGGREHGSFLQLTSLPLVVFPFLKPHVDSRPRFRLFDDRGFYSDEILSRRQESEQ